MSEETDIKNLFILDKNDNTYYQVYFNEQKVYINKNNNLCYKDSNEAEKKVSISTDFNNTSLCYKKNENVIEIDTEAQYCTSSTQDEHIPLNISLTVEPFDVLLEQYSKENINILETEVDGATVLYYKIKPQDVFYKKITKKYIKKIKKDIKKIKHNKQLNNEIYLNIFKQMYKEYYKNNNNITFNSIKINNKPGFITTNFEINNDSEIKKFTPYFYNKNKQQTIRNILNAINSLTQEQRNYYGFA